MFKCFSMNSNRFSRIGIALWSAALREPNTVVPTILVSFLSIASSLVVSELFVQSDAQGVIRKGKCANPPGWPRGAEACVTIGIPCHQVFPKLTGSQNAWQTNGSSISDLDTMLPSLPAPIQRYARKTCTQAIMCKTEPCCVLFVPRKCQMQHATKSSADK